MLKQDISLILYWKPNDGGGNVADDDYNECIFHNYSNKFQYSAAEYR